MGTEQSTLHHCVWIHITRGKKQTLIIVRMIFLTHIQPKNKKNQRLFSNMYSKLQNVMLSTCEMVSKYLHLYFITQVGLALINMWMLTQVSRYISSPHPCRNSCPAFLQMGCFLYVMLLKNELLNLRSRQALNLVRTKNGNYNSL